MGKLILKMTVYFILILLVLEALVRVFHLYTEDPPRFIDSQGVEKRVPNSHGYAVTGNRNQNFSEFRINASGFNSFREFNPSVQKIEIALIGDSFIEGFHQDYDKSTARKIENRLNNGTEVYEYGYAGYDFANQIHLTQAYADDFQTIDYVVMYLDYETDLDRDQYLPNKARIELLSSPLFQIRDNIKLFAYTSKTGVLESIKELALKATSTETEKQRKEANAFVNRESIRLQNFKTLCNTYRWDTKKMYLLLDGRKTPKSFLDFCEQNAINYIDYGLVFGNSETPTTLLYDQHWNDHGRNLIAKIISDSLQQSATLLPQ